MEDYNVFFSAASLVSFVLVLARVSGMIATAPLFSTFPVPNQIKAGISVLFAFLTFPFVAKASSFIMPTDLGSLGLLAAKETLIGVIIGFCASLIFSGIQIGGQLLATQMGLAMANALDPVTKMNVPIIGQLYLFLASFIFISIGGFNALFSCVMQSYSSMPIGLDFSFAVIIAPKILLFTSQLFSIALSVIIPIYATLILTDISMAFMAKMAPQMNVFMVGLPVKVLIGITMMTILLPNTGIYLTKLINRLLEALIQIFM